MGKPFPFPFKINGDKTKPTTSSSLPSNIQQPPSTIHLDGKKIGESGGKSLCRWPDRWRIRFRWSGRNRAGARRETSDWTLEWRFVCSLFLFWGYRDTIRLKSEPGLFYRDSAGKFCAAEYFREGKKTTWISWRYLWISSIYWIFSQILPLIAFQ